MSVHKNICPFVMSGIYVRVHTSCVGNVAVIIVGVSSRVVLFFSFCERHSTHLIVAENCLIADVTSDDTTLVYDYCCRDNYEYVCDDQCPYAPASAPFIAPSSGLTSAPTVSPSPSLNAFAP